MASRELLTKITQSIIANQVALDFNEQIKHTNYYKRSLKNKLNLLLKELIPLEKKEFDLFYENAEQACSDCHEAQRNMITELSSLEFYHFDNVRQIIIAYKKDPKSIEGIVKKINKR